METNYEKIIENIIRGLVNEAALIVTLIVKLNYILI